MLLNWNTIDACFLSAHLHMRTRFQFALTCLAAFLLVIFLEFLRKRQRSFDRYLRDKHAFLQENTYVEPNDVTKRLLDAPSTGSLHSLFTRKRSFIVVLEQVARGLIHATQFSISYCIMLLFMYSNGTHFVNEIRASQSANA